MIFSIKTLKITALDIVMLSVDYAVFRKKHYDECHYAGCHYVECHYVECHYAECCYAEGHGAQIFTI